MSYYSLFNWHIKVLFYYKYIIQSRIRLIYEKVLIKKVYFFSIMQFEHFKNVQSFPKTKSRPVYYLISF